jgi:hypothetical protein
MSNNGSKWCWPSTRLAIYHRDGFACVYCAATERALTLDHVTPVELGGTHAPTNLVTACVGCNSAKQHKTMRAWLAYLRGRGMSTEGLARRIRRACARRIDRDEGRRLAALRRAA